MRKQENANNVYDRKSLNGKRQDCDVADKEYKEYEDNELDEDDVHKLAKQKPGIVFNWQGLWKRTD